MKIEIFVVNTGITQERVKLNIRLTRCKTDLIRLFGGLTEIKDCSGYWVNDNNIDTDKVNLWLIYAKETKKEFLNSFNVSFIEILYRMKELTKQKALAYTLDNEIYFI